MRNFSRKLKDFYSWCFHPIFVEDIKRRQTAQLSSVFILVNWVLSLTLVALNGVLSPLPFSKDEGLQPGILWVSLISIIYPITRTKYFEIAAFLYTAISTATIYSFYYTDPRSFTAFLSIGFLFIISIYAVTTFKIMIALVLVAAFEGMVILICIQEKLGVLIMINSSAILAMVSILTMVVNALREKNFKTRLETEEKLTEQRISLEFMRKTETANKLMLLGEVSSGIAHEVKNPLTVIAGKALVIKTRAENGKLVDEDAVKYTDHILKTVEIINKIITNVQRMAHSNDSETFETKSLDDIIQTSIDMTREKIHNYQVKFEYPQKTKIFIKSNDIQLSQVLINLISNAVDAIRDFDEKWIKVSVDRACKGQIIIRVTDSGPGLSKEIQKKILTPFYTTKGKGEGTGMGLSFCRRIIEAHQGEFGVDSSSQNTCFYFTLFEDIRDLKAS